MNKSRRILIVITCIAAILTAVVFMIVLPTPGDAYYAKPGDVVKLDFEFDKKLEFGDYYFDLDNGKDNTYPLCFCLTEKNTYPPDCSGDVKYLYKNTPGTMCIPLKIGNGRCSVAPIETLGYATDFILPLEYSWTKPFQKIVVGIRVPQQAPKGAKLVAAVTIFKQNNTGKMEKCRLYEKTIIVKHSGSDL